MKGKSKSSFKSVTKKTANHVAKSPAVPPEYAHNLRVANRASSRAMRVAQRGR